MDPRVGTTETFSVVKKCALSIQKVFSKSFRGTWFHKGQQNRRTHMFLNKQTAPAARLTAEKCLTAEKRVFGGKEAFAACLTAEKCVLVEEGA